MSTSRLERRLRSLDAFGAPPATAQEIVACDTLPYAPDAGAPVTLPLPDEPLADAWADYVEEARQDGVETTLKRHLVQLRFPVQAGISDTDDYRAATRRGDVTAATAFGEGLALRSPETLELAVVESMAGRVPVLVAGDRSDFVALVQALTARNEPVDVPDAMGACLVKGLNNWSRVAAYRRNWASSAGNDAAAWAEEFKRLVPRKDLYQDRVVLLSRGPYSAVPAADVGLEDDAWRALSVAIRREHELTHYLTYRVFGSMRSHVVDEIVADFIGLSLGYGHYRADLAARFFGLESARFRPGGRLAHYLGEPPLSPGAFEVVQALTRSALANLEAMAREHPVSSGDLAFVGRLSLALAGLTIEELAARDVVLAAAAAAR